MRTGRGCGFSRMPASGWPSLESRPPGIVIGCRHALDCPTHTDRRTKWLFAVHPLFWQPPPKYRIYCVDEKILSFHFRHCICGVVKRAISYTERSCGRSPAFREPPDLGAVRAPGGSPVADTPKRAALRDNRTRCRGRTRRGPGIGAMRCKELQQSRAHVRTSEPRGRVRLSHGFRITSSSTSSRLCGGCRKAISACPVEPLWLHSPLRGEPPTL